jgi:cell division protein FtsN
MATAAPNPLASGDTAYLYRAAIGERSQDYYLRHFARFDGEGKAGTSWNWAAYWTTFNWLVYRRMWGWALAYVAALIGLALLVFGVGKLVLNYSDTSAILLSLLLLTAAFVVPGLYANAWFYTHCNEKITAALNKAPEIKQAAALLAADAPQSRRLWVLALGNAAVLSVALSALNWFQTTESALPQLAREQSGPMQPAAPSATAPVSAPAPAPAVTASAPTPEPAAPVAQASPAPAEPVAAAPAPPKPEPMPPVTAAAKPVAPPASAPAMMQAADRPARAEPAAPAPEAAAAPAPAVQTPAAPTSPRPAPAARKPAPQTYVWVVQVGAYAQEDNARKALAQVQSLGLEAGAETFGSQPLMRVRVGPFTRQDEAERAALRIKSLDLPALVIRQRP